MSKRKYTISGLTDAQLADIEAKYPKAVKTVRRANYRVIAMLLECGLEVPHISVEKSDPELPPLLREKKHN